MGVASHLGIKLTEYDSRIRTFIPDYEEMLDVGASAIPSRARVVIDLGIGTGALSARCLKVAPAARVVGLDLDPAILTLAARRLGERASFAAGSFLRAPLPSGDAIVGSFALHHVRTRAAKASLYRRVRAALRPGGVFVSVDCQPATDAGVRRAQFDAWQAHLRRTYRAGRARAIFAAWSHEDVYVPLDAEIALLRSAGLRVELLWRKGAFAVLRGTR